MAPSHLVLAALFFLAAHASATGNEDCIAGDAGDKLSLMQVIQAPSLTRQAAKQDHEAKVVFPEATAKVGLSIATEVASSDKLLYVGIMSAPDNRQKRDVVRKSYLNELRKKHTDGRVFAKFIIGHVPFTSYAQGTLGTPEQLKLEKQLEEEEKAHGDILRVPLPEKYENLPDKVIHSLQHGLQQQYSFLMKIDDDMDMNIDETEKFVAEHSPDKFIYAGASNWATPAYESQKGPDGKFAPYFAGPCYMLSRGLAHQILEVHGAHTAEFIRYGSSSEDVDMGRWVQFEKKVGGKVSYITFPQFLAKGMA